MIRLQDLSYTYPEAERPILHEVVLEIPQGDMVLVVGASGAGKSTLLRCLNGLVPHFYGGTIQGDIEVCGENPIVRQPRGMSQWVGFVFQDPETQFVMDTVESELAFAMENHALPQAIMQARILEVLKDLGIAHLKNRRISTLSGGEKQRVALGAVLTLQPQILVLDEPTSQVDPPAAQNVLETLQRLNRSLGITIVISEHRIERVLPFVNKIIHLPGDGTLQVGPPREMLEVLDQAPPLIELGQALGWCPLPLSVEEARRFPLPPQETLTSPRPSPAGPVEITVEDLWYAYNGSPVLQGLHFEIRQGELVALVGINGSGKTTLLKLLVGLLQPMQGKVTIRGMDTRRTPLEELIRIVGYVPQNPNSLLFAETVRDELRFTRQSHGLPTDILPPGMLESLGLAPYLSQYPRDLSVGERQRVALAAILAAEPEILLLDEPTRGVDRRQKKALLHYLRTARAAGQTVIFATHDVELVSEGADRMILLEGGRLLADGTPAEVMAQYPAFASQLAALYHSKAAKPVHQEGAL